MYQVWSHIKHYTKAEWRKTRIILCQKLKRIDLKMRKYDMSP